MSIERELLKRAIDLMLRPTGDRDLLLRELTALILDIKDALEKPSPEPVCWWDGLTDTTSECMVNALREKHINIRSSTYKDFPIPLYTSLPVRELLSDDAIEEEHNLHGRDCSHIGLESFNDGVKFAEKHHGI